MSILVNQNTVVLIQGITGKEGSRATREMIEYGTKVVAGVTPGKGGVTTEEGIPVFNSVKEAIKEFPNINTSLVVVPPNFVLDAVHEAMHAGIGLIDVLTEKVPVADASYMVAYAKYYGSMLVGPSSVGIISPEKAKVGSIGSSGIAKKVFSSGNVGVISKSGGMTAEISRILTESGLGQSTVVGIGGDPVIGADFCDMGLEFEKDEETKAIVIFGEVGGAYEEQFAHAMKERKITKPVVALIAGQFSENLPQDTVLGHAGAIVSKGKGSASSKIKHLKDAGALVANIPEDIPNLIRKSLSQ